jgi:hypothetical protein
MDEEPESLTEVEAADTKDDSDSDGDDDDDDVRNTICISRFLFALFFVSWDSAVDMSTGCMVDG